MPAIASKAYKAGDLIFECKPIIHYTKSQYKGKICDNCLNKSDSLKKCGKCFRMHYCNKSCQTKDWKYHKNECHFFQKLTLDERKIFHEFCHLNTSVVEQFLRLMAFIKNPKFRTKKYQLIDGSNICFEEIKFDDKQMDDNIFEDIFFENVFLYLQKLSGKQFSRKDFNKLVSTAVLLSLYKLPTDPNEVNDLFNSIAMGYYLQFPSFGHSCHPNCGVVTNGIKTQIRALKDVEMGEKLTEKRILKNYCKCKAFESITDKYFTYKRFDAIKQQISLRFMTNAYIDRKFSLKNEYLLASELDILLWMISGGYDPLSSEMIASHFIIFVYNYCNCNEDELKSWYEKVSKAVEVTHGIDHPLYKMIESVFNGKYKNNK